MARKNESILKLLIDSPWWISVVFSAFVFIFLRFVFPTIGSVNPIVGVFSKAARMMAPLISLVFLLPAPISALKSWQKKKLLDSRKDLGSVRMLSWRQFEEVVGEAYRRQGYKVIENSSSGPDGGVDLTIQKDGNAYIVQCKHWRENKVGVKIIREMYGVMTARQATGAIIITSGSFTQEAKDFASGKPIEIITGARLAQMIRDVQGRIPRSTELKSSKFEGR